MDMEASAADHAYVGYYQTTKKTSQGSDGGGSGDGGGCKSRVDLYAGAVAQRALYGPTSSRCRGAERQRQQVAGNGGKESKQPSRLSKMSGAEGT